ncbi:hypothetical protein CARUB_v10023843mg, partial [Capsella rubella]
GLIAEVACKRCGELEDAIHVLVNCSYAKQVWELSPLVKPPVTSMIHSMHDLLIEAKEMITLPPIGLGITPLFPWVFWFLWKARNRLVFERKETAASETCVKALSEARSWHLANLGQSSRTPSSRRSQVSKPHKDAFSCFTDASWQQSSHSCGLVWIIKSPSATVCLQGTASRPFVSSALVAEALALKAGIQEALAMGVSRLACFSDCLVLVQLLNSGGHVNEIDGVLEDIHNALGSFLSFSFHFIPRAENSQADALAKSALNSCTSSFVRI